MWRSGSGAAVRRLEVTGEQLTEHPNVASAKAGPTDRLLRGDNCRMVMLLISSKCLAGTIYS